MANTLSAISVVFTTMVRSGRNVKGVIKEVMLQRIAEPSFRITNINNLRSNSSRVIGVTREGWEVMGRGVFIVEVKHILEETAHS